VRARYGHSIDVEVPEGSGPVPETLYQGTVRSNLAAIRAEGLRPMSRQWVHLSPDVATARAVGRRHGEDVVVLAVDAQRLADEVDVGLTRRAETVYTCETVPPDYVRVVEDEPG
jgi:putative RNA 2'-phosphotransferase